MYYLKILTFYIKSLNFYLKILTYYIKILNFCLKILTCYLRNFDSSPNLNLLAQNLNLVSRELDEKIFWGNKSMFSENKSEF